MTTGGVGIELELHRDASSKLGKISGLISTSSLRHNDRCHLKLAWKSVGKAAVGRERNDEAESAGVRKNNHAVDGCHRPETSLAADRALSSAS